MQATGRQPQRAPVGAPVHYERDRPEQTTLCRLVQQHAATFFAETEVATGANLAQFVKDESDVFLECGILAHGFLRLRCGDCGHDRLVRSSLGARVPRTCVDCTQRARAAIDAMRRRARDQRGWQVANIATRPCPTMSESVALLRQLLAAARAHCGRRSDRAPPKFAGGPIPLPMDSRLRLRAHSRPRRTPQSGQLAPATSAHGRAP